MKVLHLYLPDARETLADALCQRCGTFVCHTIIAKGGRTWRGSRYCFICLCNLNHDDVHEDL